MPSQKSDTFPNLKKEFSHLKTLPPKKKILLAAIFVTLFVASFLGATVLSLNLTKKPPTPVGKEPLTTREPTLAFTPTPKPRALLSLSPSDKLLKVGEAIPVSVSISEETAQAVDIVLTYNAKVFSAKNITKGEAFPLLLQKKIDKGRVTVSASIDPKKSGTSAASGEVFSFTLTALSATPSSAVNFDTSQTTVAKNGENILGTAVGGSYEVIK